MIIAPQLSIIIPSRDPAQCQPLIDQLRGYGHTHIIVVHPHHTRAPAGAHSITTPDLLSAAAARNRAAHTVQHGILVFLDDDVTLRSDVPRLLAWCLNDPHIVASGGVIYDAPHNGYWQRSMHRCMTTAQYWASARHTAPLLMSMALAVRTEHFHAMGGFAESFAGAAGEDAEFSIRMQTHGALYVLPQARLWHHPTGNEARSAIRRLFRYGRAWIRVIRHSSFPSMLRHIPAACGWLIGIAAPLLAAYDMLRLRPWRHDRATIWGCWACRIAWYVGVAYALTNQEGTC